MYFDAHSDIWTDVTVKREHGEKNVLKNHHLDRLRAGQVEGSIFVIWVERPDIQDYAVRTAQIKQAILDETAECDEVQIVHTVAEMKQARDAGKFYIWIGIEGMGAEKVFTELALRLGKKSQSMIWCYRFDDYLLEYILSQSSHQISPELLVSSRLNALINYDRENKTELYRTLQVYLEHERNSLQTAKTLFIHRSSLVYRLERIQKITKIDLDNPRNRLLLQICFLLIQEKEPASD